jgi:hypothetical protein
MRQPPNREFRPATLLVAVLLGSQCVWLLLAELSRPGITRLPNDATAAAAARSKRTDAAWAARIGAIRGDLWAESAFTHGDLMWADGNGGAGLTQASTLARSILDHALEDAPHQSGAWLLLAGLASRYQFPDINATQALKMSYYTGPSEWDLMPLRLRIAAHSDTFTDIELRDFIRRDVRLLLARQQKPAIAVAYNAASPAGKRFIEQTVGEIDPSVVGTLRAAQKP